MFDRNTVLFAFMCVIWGTTWLATKLGVNEVPPIFFAGTRFIAAGLLLLLLAAVRREWRWLTQAELLRLTVVQLLMVVLTYGPLFWAIKYVSSGLTAVLDMALMPVCLLGFGILLKEERWSPRRSLALGLGFGGLAVLFGPQIVMPTDSVGLFAVGAILFSAVVYCLGSVMARPITKSTSASFASGLTMLPGGIILVVVSLASEPGAMAAANFDWPITAWAGWAFLLVFGSLIAFTAYMRLIAVWGPAGAGSYAYVSPVLAVAVGVFILDEHIGLRDGAGMGLLLLAAFYSLRVARHHDGPLSTAPDGREPVA